MKRTIRKTLPAPRTILGFRKDGRPIYPIAGGAEDGGAPDGGAKPAGDEDEGEGGESKPVRDEAARKVNQDLERKLNEARRELEAARATANEVDALKKTLARAAGIDPDADADESVDLDKAIDSRFQAERKRLDARLVRAEVKAAATGKLADPEDALTFLALDKFEISEDGAVDEAAIATAIADLVNTKPYLAAKGQERKGSSDGGPRDDGSKSSSPSQLTESDLERMSSEEIRKAQDEGRLKRLLTGS